MKDAALYYPKMTLPPTAWLSRTLLYWDEVATIVPESEQAGVRDNPYMAELTDLGLLQMIDPTPTLSEQYVQDQISRAFREFQNLPAGASDELDYPARSSMRAEKLLYSVRYQLERQGHVSNHSDSPGWLRVDSNIAGWYMSLLAGLMATSLSADGSTSYKPVTDDKRAIHASRADIEANDRSQFIYRSIHEVLPGPSISIAPGEIMDFKNRYNSELRRLRHWIDDKFLLASQISSTDISLWERHIREEVEDEIEILREGMNRRRWPRVLLGTVGALIGNGVGMANSVVSSDSMLELGLGVGAATIAASTTLPAVIESARYPRYDRRAPLAYAALTANLRR